MAKPKPPAPRIGQTRLRCAVYTRKSSEEGLEQSFNSLDAQREACAAYVASQRHEGWQLLPTFYDDGGFSGGSMDRPALTRLLADVQAGRIDVVVVYKVDRLTRALSDFAKIVEVFDRRQVSFVSVTQAFNTTSSMGRLTLNVLLSFAQFEREVTGERIRDKIAASKRKGMWMGGLPPLGYDVSDKKLVVNAAEAETVRLIFRRYCSLRSVRLLAAELAQAGILSKARRGADGGGYGAQPLGRGALYAMLANRLYRGEVVHKSQSYPGEHDAIIDAELFAEAQAILAHNRVERDDGVRAEAPSLLAGLVYDAAGERLTPSHTNKRGVRYRYYVSRRLITGAADAAEANRQATKNRSVSPGDSSGTDEAKPSGQRIPAAKLEAIVTDRLRALLGSGTAMQDITRDRPAPEQRALVAAAARLAVDWPALPHPVQRQIVQAVIVRIDVGADQIDIGIDGERLLHRIGVGSVHETAEHPTAIATDATLQLTLPVALKRVGMEMRLMMPGEAAGPDRDESLARLIARAHRIRERLTGDTPLSIDEVAKAEALTRSYATRLLRLSYLAPDITARLISGEHPPELNATQLMQDTRLPMDWAEQRTALAMA
ncbi:recombinase family protein [Methylobacterium sp. CM6246]